MGNKVGVVAGCFLLASLATLPEVTGVARPLLSWRVPALYTALLAATVAGTELMFHHPFAFSPAVPLFLLPSLDSL